MQTLKQISKFLVLLLSLVVIFTMFSCKEEPADDNNNNNNNDPINPNEQIVTKEEAWTDVVVGNAKDIYQDATVINLNSTTATINNQAISEYDYTWHVDPSVAHTDVKNSPAEYYTGTQPEDTACIYIDHEVYYYPNLDTASFKLVNYDGENEWAYYYTDGENNDFIFATLPVFEGANSTIPTYMMHTEAEAAENKVLHINVAGTYILEGTWNGQINIDLGDEAFSDETKKVTLILNGANIKCTVAPGILVEQAYEVDNTWEDAETHTNTVDVSNEKIGVNIILADDSQNIITGNNIYRMLKTKYKDEASTDEIKVQKKARKYDGALYSCVSMNINGSTNGTGKLAVNSSFEGIDSELHLTFNGGYTVVTSQDDGSNVNEDNVSIFTMNGGTLAINAAQGAEGDGIDSNGYININGGTLKIYNVVAPDSPIDSEDGILYNGGEVYINGVKKELTVGQTYNEISSNEGGMGGNVNPFNIDTTNFDLADFKAKVAALGDDATINDVLELLGINIQDPGEQGGGGVIPGEQGEGGVTPPGEQGQGGTTPPDGQGEGGVTPPDGEGQGGTNPPDKPNA